MKSNHFEKYKYLGLNISYYRKEKGFSQEKLCSLIDMKQTSLARLERGGVSPGIDTLLKILYPLGYTIEVKKIKK